MLDFAAKSAELPVKGSFLNLYVKPSTRNVEIAAKSSKKPVTKARVASAPRTRSVHKREVIEDSQECIYISSSPKKQKIFTKHQKEKKIEQRLDRNVPVMYNSLDVNSQEPFMFDINSQSQALPSAPVTPEKVVEVSPPKPVTPGFSLRKMLFLSPQPSAGTSTEANQSVAAKTLATLPLSSPDILTSQSDQENVPSDSDEDLYCDPPEEPDSAPIEPSELAITPPPSEGVMPDSGIELQASQLPVELPGNESFSPEDSNKKGGMISNVLKSMISYVVPKMVKPNTLTIVSNSDTDKSDDTGSQSSTPCDTNTTSDTTPLHSDITPLHSKSSSEISADISETYVKTTPLVPPESLIETVSETPAESPIAPLVFVEDSQNVMSEKTTATGETIIPDSVSPDSLETVEINQTAPDIQQFSNDISFTDCSTARESANKQTKAKKAEPDRRSTRRLTKRIKSEDLGIKDSPSKFKRVKSSDDMINALTDPSKLMTPIKESEEFAMLRKSVRPRKSSAKLRDESFINTDYPASILNTNSKDEIDEEAVVKKNVQSSQNSKIAAKTPILEVGKKKRGRPRKNTPGVAPLESPRKKVTNTVKDLSSANESKAFITIPDSQSEHNSTESSENSVVFVGEVSFDAKQTSDNTIRRQDTIMIPDTPVIETAPLLTDALNQLNEVQKSAVEDLKELTSNILVLESIRSDYQISEDSSSDTTVKNISNSQTSLPEAQTSVPDSQTSIPDSQTSVPDSQTNIPDSQTSIPDIQTSIPDSQTSIPDSQTSIPDSQTSIPDSQTSIPDSQINMPDSQPASAEAEPQQPTPTSSQPKKKRGRPFKKTPTLSPINSRKSLRLTATPSETKNLITSYMSKSPKPYKKDKFKDSDDTFLPEASLEQSKLSDSKVQSESSTAENDDSVESKYSVNQVAGKEVSQNAPHSAQNDSESLTQSLAPNFQLTEEDDSPSLQLLPLPTPSQEISPQETESVPSDSSSQRRSRKQSKPKNWAAPRRKSSRLTTKSRTAENMGKEKEDSFTESLSQDSEIIELRSQVLVPDSLQPPAQESKENSGESPINKQSKEKFKKDSETKTSVGDAEGKKETLSQILSLDISSSDKNNLLSPDSKIQELSTPQKHASLQSPGYNESPTSVGSVETFGKPVAKLEFSTIHQTPDPGLDTQEDLTGSVLVRDTLQDPVGDTLDDLVEATLMEPVEDTLPDPIEALVADTDSPDHNTLLEDDDIPADVLKLASPYKELEEFPETDTSVIFCANSQIPSSQEDSSNETDHVVIQDSQTAEENAAKLEISRTARSLKRKPSIPSNLPDEIQDLVAVQMSVAQNLEVEVKTPPKSLKLGAVGEPITPTTPKTPSSILKRKLEPGSGSPSLSKRHVTFGPLPEPHRDPNEVTPRRHSKFRKSPAPPQPKIRTPEPSSSEGAVFPSLAHSTVRAHDIIRTLCTGFTLSQRNYNLSIVSSTIKTIGDLARLTPSQIEEYPFITPKLIQVRRNLKKFEASQSPMLLFSVKSFLSETKAREMSQKSESERLEPVSEVEDVGSKESAKIDNDSETHHYEAEEGKENMTDSDELKGSETEEPMATELEDDDKENRDPNDKHAPDDSKTEPTEQTKTVEIIEITSSQSTEETDVTDSKTTEVSGQDSVQPATIFNSNSVLPTTDALSEATVIQNSLSAVVSSREQDVITVGRSETNSTSTEDTEALEPVVVSSDNTNSDSTSEECKIAGSEVSRNDSEFNPEIEIVDKRTSQVNKTAAVRDATSSTEQTSESLESDESHPTASVICEDSPEISLGLTCDEELSLSCEMKKNNSHGSPSVIAETTSESSQSISQDISKTISEFTREAEFEIQGKIVESQEEGMDFDFKLSSTDSDTADGFADQKPKSENSSICSLIRDMPGLSSPVSRDEVTSTDDITHETETRASDRDVTVSDDVTIYGDITNPLVDYPLTQPRPLVDYPLTQDVHTFSFEDEIQRIEDKLSKISDPEMRHNERYKIIERLCRGGRENS